MSGNMHNKKYNFNQCWLDSVNLYSLLVLVFVRFRHNYRTARYLRISDPVLKLVSFFGLKKILKLKAAWEDCPGMTSCEERNICHEGYREKSALTFEIAKSAFNENRFAEELNKYYGKDKVDFFLKQEIAIDIEDFITILNYIKWFKSKAKEESAFNIVLTKNNPWLGELKAFGKDLTRKIYGYPDLEKRVFAILLPFKIILEAIVNSFAVFLLLNKKRIDNPLLPKIAVMHAHGADLSKRSDYFWFPGSGISPDRILVYFKYDCWPPTSEAKKLIESYGMRWVDLLPLKLKGSGPRPELYFLPVPVFIRNSIESFLMVIKLLLRWLSGKYAFSSWQWERLSNLINRVSFYYSFFKIYNVKVHFSLYEMGIDMIASNIAVKLNGGVDFSHHWSNYDVTEVSIGKICDVYFVWGPYFKKNFFERGYYNVGHFVFTGYPYDSKFKEARKKSSIYRRRLLENGARFIVVFFDQVYSSSWPQANKDIEDLYRALLDKVITDREFGLITKAKKIRNFWEKMPALAELAKKAEDSGRCLYLDCSCFTNDAAQAGDLTIGFGVYSTPALESALSGQRAITCDLQNFSGHPFYIEGFNSIVFNKLDNMLTAIDDLKNKTKGSARIGDYSFILKEIDPFRDGGASGRIGRFVGDIIEKFDNGGVSSEAITNALEKYTAQWGPDKACSINSGET